MSTAVRARTARKAHRCETCRHRSIAPGHRYLLHTLFPGDINSSGRPWVSKECIACVEKREEGDGLLVADACSSFCCALEPCALVIRHAGDHHCGRDALDLVGAS